MEYKRKVWQYLHRFLSCGLNFCFLQPPLHLFSSSPPSCRHEHRARGYHRTPLRHARLCTLAHHQPGGDGLREWGEGQPRGGPADGQTASGAAGEAGVHHGDQDGARKQLPLSQKPARSPGRPSHIDVSALSATLTKKILLCKRSDCLYL